MRQDGLLALIAVIILGIFGWLVTMAEVMGWGVRS